MTGPARERLLDRVRMRLAEDVADADIGRVTLQESELLLDSVVLAELSGQVSAQLRGAGPLEELLALPGVTDVLVNAADSVWIDRGRGLERTTTRFPCDDAVRDLAARLAAQAGRRLDDASPFVDAALPDGTRLHAILPPLTAHPAISLRVLARRQLSLADLISAGAISSEVGELLRAIVAARLTVLISGGTGTGKTTLLSALLATVDCSERIVTVEDAAELAVSHPHVVGLVSRAVNTERAGAVGLAELVRQALRMRVDRLVVGEFRGGEITELLTALNTGHAGGAATVHANSVRDVPSRLVALGALGGMPSEVLLAQAASALDVLVHVARDRSGTRRVAEIALWPGDHAGNAAGLVWHAAGGVGPAAWELSRRICAAGVTVPPLLGATQ